MNKVDWKRHMDETDRQIIQATQEGLPLVPRPYHAVAEALGLSSADVMARMQRMLGDGVIRRIGVVPNHYRLGIKANGMSVWDVDDAHVRDAGMELGALDCVTHCYRRPRHLPDWPYNLFAMVHGRRRDEVEALVAEMARILGARARRHEILFSTRILKKTGLRLGM